jgi:hypothetical protein
MHLFSMTLLLSVQMNWMPKLAIRFQLLPDLMTANGLSQSPLPA